MEVDGAVAAMGAGGGGSRDLADVSRSAEPDAVQRLVVESHGQLVHNIVHVVGNQLWLVLGIFQCW